MPVFLPTTLQGAEEIVQTINELKTKVPSDPLEDDLITMAEVITEDRKPGEPTPGLNIRVKRLLIREVLNTALILASDGFFIYADKKREVEESCSKP